MFKFLELSNQEIFDRVLAHMRVQRRASVDDDGACLYRGPNGTACAIGALIRDDEYTPEIEKKNVYTLLKGVDRMTVSEGRRSLLSDLQSVHDNLSEIDSENFLSFIENDMEALAKNYGLVYKKEEPNALS